MDKSKFIQEIPNYHPGENPVKHLKNEPDGFSSVWRMHRRYVRER
jgi:hypothetical protein